jgi:hypothetical protein
VFGRGVNYGKRRGKKACTFPEKFVEIRLFFQPVITHFPVSSPLPKQYIKMAKPLLLEKGKDCAVVFYYF